MNNDKQVDDFSWDSRLHRRSYYRVMRYTETVANSGLNPKLESSINGSE